MNKKLLIFISRLVLTGIFFTILGFCFYMMRLFDMEKKKEVQEGLSEISITESVEASFGEPEEVEEGKEEPTTELTTQATTEATTEEITEEVLEETTEKQEDAAPAVVYEKPAEPIIEAVVEIASSSDAEETGSGSQFVGTYNITAYPASGNPCADGVFPQLNYTASCNDPALWHRWIYVEGVGNFYVHDHGSMAVMGYNTIDIYMGDYDTCIQFGRRVSNVYLID